MLSSIFIQPVLRAQDNSLTLEQCLSIALNENPLVSAAGHQYQASLARVNQAKAFSQPTLNFDSDLQPDPLDFKGAGESYFGIGKSVLFPGKRKINKAIALKESDQILMEAEMVKLDLVYQVKLAFYTLLMNAEKLSFAERDMELAGDFLDKTQVKFEAGDAAHVEVIRAKVEVAKVSGEIRQASNQVNQSKADLNFLLGRDKESPLEVRNGFSENLELPELNDLIQQALFCRPEIKWTQHALEKESLIRKQAGLSYLPDLDLGFSRHTIAGEAKTWDFTAALPIPVFFNQTLKGEIAETNANLKALESEMQNLQNRIRLEVESAHRNASVAKGLIDLFNQDMLNQSEEVYNLLFYSYQEGKIGGIELIEARKTFIETSKSYIDAIYNYETAVITIEKCVGRSLWGK